MADEFTSMLPQPEIDGVEKILMENQISDGVTVQFAAQLLSMKSDGARVKHCYHHLHRYRCLPRKPFNTKCDVLSNELKLKGNSAYTSRQDEEALKYYNRAITYASDSKVLSVIYANRSAALFSMKMYKECLVDVERALDAGYEEELKPKLLKRKAQCEDALKTVQIPESEYGFNLEEARKKLFKLPEKRIKGTSCASSSVDIQSFPSMGRGVIATEDIQPGQVLVNEEPYVSILMKKELLTRCYSCCSPNNSMIGCETCTYVMFCDEKCRSKSWDEGHKFECPIMTRLMCMNFSDKDLIGLKILLKARCQYSSWGEMFKTIETIENNSVSKTKNNESAPLFDSKSYALIHMLETNFEKRENTEIISKCVISATILHLLKEYTTFFGDHLNSLENILTLDENDYMWRVGGLLFRLCLISDLNTYNATVASVDLIDKSRLLHTVFAIGMYCFSSSFNHSCSPNAMFLNNETSLSILAMRPIKKGQQIFIRYGTNYTNMPLPLRRTNLEKQYKFVCRCEACTNMWPLYDSLPMANFNDKKNKRKFRNIINNSIVESLLRDNKVLAYNTVQDLYKYMSLLEECVPCKEHAQHEAIIELCWHLMSDFKNTPVNKQLSFNEYLSFMNNMFSQFKL